MQPQYESTEWLIAIDYKLLRLYHKSKPELFYQQFSLEKLVVDADYLRQFYFILCRRTLLAGIPHSQERSRILQLLEESHNAEMVIARDFYSYYHGCDRIWSKTFATVCINWLKTPKLYQSTPLRPLRTRLKIKKLNQSY
jgi:hypothetical protein